MRAALAVTPAVVILVASSATGQTQEVTFRTVANNPPSIYAEYTPLIARPNGTYLAEDGGSYFGFPTQPGGIYEITTPLLRSRPFGVRQIFAFKDDSTGLYPMPSACRMLPAR